MDHSRIKREYTEPAVPFTLKAPFQPMGDQPKAVKSLVGGLRNGEWAQVLLGATGTGKTFTMAKVIEEVQRPTLIISPNKTLAAQTASEFKDFFPDNAVLLRFLLRLLPAGVLCAADGYLYREGFVTQ